MERRKAITAAATASLTLLAGAGGMALNSGIVASGDDGIGQISLVGTTSASTTSFGDLFGWDDSTSPMVKQSDGEPVATSTASGYEDSDDDDDDVEGSDHGDDDDHRHDDDDDDHRHDDDDDDHRDRDHDREKYEGADDDD